MGLGVKASGLRARILHDTNSEAAAQVAECVKKSEPSVKRQAQSTTSTSTSVEVELKARSFEK
jgi:hypothetical protein